MLIFVIARELRSVIKVFATELLPLLIITSSIIAIPVAIVIFQDPTFVLHAKIPTHLWINGKDLALANLAGIQALFNPSNVLNSSTLIKMEIMLPMIWNIANLKLVKKLRI